MADIDLERKRSGMGWLWGLLALLAVVLLAWWLWPDTEEAEFAEADVGAEVAPVEPLATTPEPVATAAGVTIGDILGSPDAYIDQPFPRAEVNVAEVVTDRGFWIEDQGERLFALIVDRPQEQPVDLNPGQTIRIDRGTLRDRTFLPELPGAPLDQETENIAEQQPIFLVVEEGATTILEGGQPQPGTDPAQSIE